MKVLFCVSMGGFGLEEQLNKHSNRKRVKTFCLSSNIIYEF